MIWIQAFHNALKELSSASYERSEPPQLGMLVAKRDK
jgi:hypothetical protein